MTPETTHCKVIILEGSDGSGKTTVAKNLESLYNSHGFNVEMWHYGPHSPDKTSVQEYLEPLIDWCEEQRDFAHKVLIIDRFHLGELVYGPVLRGFSQMTDDQYEYIEHYLDKIGAIRLYVRPARSVVLERFRQRGDDLVDIGKIMDIIGRYDRLVAHSGKWTQVGGDLQNIFRALGGN